MSVEGRSVGGGVGGGGVGVGGGISGGVGVASIGGIGGIEGGGLAGAASVSGAAIFRMPSLEAAPVVVNEGPVSLSVLENTMTIAKFNPIGEIAFNPSAPSVIEQAEKVAAAVWDAPQLNAADATASLRASAKQSSSSIILSEIAAPRRGGARNDNFILPQVEPQIVPLVEPRVWPVVLPLVEPAPALQVSPALEPIAKTGLSPKTEQKVHYQVAPAVSPQPLFKEQEVEEEVVEKTEQVEPKDSLEEEEEETEKRLFLEDEKALAVRKFEIKQAVKLAFASVKDAKLSTVLGSLVAAFLPGEHAGNRSQALHEKGPDGSYEETVEAIATSGEFSSPEQAEKRFEEIVAENKPIKNGKDGSPVTLREVLRVFRFRVVKPPVAVEIYTKRVVKKQAQVPVGQVVAPKTGINEIPLEELSTELAEVFEKAA